MLNPSWINMNTVHFRWSDIPYAVEGSVMLSFDLLSSRVKMMQENCFETWWQWLSFSSWHVAGIWVTKSSVSATASLRVLLTWKTSGAYREWFDQGCWIVESRHQNERELMLSHLFSEELWHTEAIFVFPWMASWTARLPQLAVGNLLPARYTISGTACRIESSTWEVSYVSNKGGLLISQTSKGSDIFLGLSCRDAHHIAGGCLSLASRLSTHNSCPLLAFNNVRVDPHCFSSRGRDWNKTFLPLVVRISIDHS